MYKKLFIVILVLFSLLIKPAKVLADPVDITDSYFYFEKEIDNGAMNESEIKMYSYINWLQANILVNPKGELMPQDLLKFQDKYNAYVKDNIKISNNDQPCTVQIDESPVTEDQISLSLGTRVIGTFSCPSKIENVKIENKLFLNNFPFESNYTSIYDGDKLLHAVTLGNNRQSYEFNTNDLKQNPKGDETVINSANVSADQVTSNLPDELKGEANTKINTNSGIPVTAGSSISNTNQTAQATPSSAPSPKNMGPKKRSFISTLTDSLFLKTSAIKDQSIPILLVLVFCLGFLHTVEAGHSKTILASSMLHNKMSFKKGIAYASIFTLTHLGDIIIVGLILLVADNYLNILSNFSMLERYAGYALFVMSIYLLLKNLQFFIRKWVSKNKNLEMPGHIHFEANENITLKDQLILGFLAGLAPCVFGWSIFVLILSTNKIWILIPAILFFGLGIFAALTCVVFLITHLKKGPYSRFEKIAEISPLISAIVLLIYAIFLIS